MRRRPVSTARKPKVIPLSLIGSVSVPSSPRSVRTSGSVCGESACSRRADASRSAPTRSSSSSSRTVTRSAAAAQAEALAQVDERAAQRGSQVVAANQIDGERLQQLHALRAPPRGGARGAEAADEVGEHERDQHVDDERRDARRRFDAERVVRLGEEEVEGQRADQREDERERAAAVRGHERRQQQHERDRCRCRGRRAAARAPRSRRAAGTAKPRPPARRARPPPRPARGGGGGSRRRGGRARSLRSQLARARG